MRILKVEYYDSNIGNWISYCETTNINYANERLNDPIFGNPFKRVAEYEKTGVRKIKYKFIKEINAN